LFPSLFGAFFRIQIGSSTTLYWLAFQGIPALLIEEDIEGEKQEFEIQNIYLSQSKKLSISSTSLSTITKQTP